MITKQSELLLVGCDNIYTNGNFIHFPTAQVYPPCSD